MKKQALYHYHFRPAYGSDELLLEFITGTESSTFIPDLLDAIKPLNPRLNTGKDIWVNDETLYTIQSDMGVVSLSIDSWGFAFILGENCQDGLARINELLTQDARFERMDFPAD